MRKTNVKVIQDLARLVPASKDQTFKNLKRQLKRAWNRTPRHKRAQFRLDMQEQTVKLAA